MEIFLFHFLSNQQFSVNTGNRDRNLEGANSGRTFRWLDVIEAATLDQGAGKLLVQFCA